MFEKLFNVSYKRDWQGAFGFYIFYLFVFSLAMACLFLVYRRITGEMTIEQMDYFRKIISSAIVALFMIFVLESKKFNKDITYVSLVVGSTLVAFFGGLLFGLVPISYITTLKR